MTRPGTLFGAARGPIWGLLDQAVYAGTNFLAAIVVSRVLGPTSFGAFALVLSVWATIWLLARTVVAERFLVRAAALSEHEWSVEAGKAAGALVIVGSLAGAGVAGASLFVLDGPVGRPLLALAAFVPILMLQDFWRVAAFSQDRGQLAFVNDLVWAAVQVSAFSILWALHALTPTTALVAWALGGLAGALVGQAQFHVWPALSKATLSWTGTAFVRGGWFGAARAIQAAGLQIVLILVGAFVGLAAVGGLRAITTLFGPLGTFYRAMELPALSAMSKATETRMPRVAALYALLLVPVGTLYASLILAERQRVVLAVFGVAFTSFDALILPMGITYVAMGIATIPAMALRTMEEGRTVLAIDALSGVGLIVLALVLLPLSGVLGAAWACAIAGAVQTVLFMTLYIRRYRSRRTRASPRTSAASRVAPEL
jgi:O-antigen/teichoic acid export membrane protein